MYNPARAQTPHRPPQAPASGKTNPVEVCDRQRLEIPPRSRSVRSVRSASHPTFAPLPTVQVQDCRTMKGYLETTGAFPDPIEVSLSRYIARPRNQHECLQRIEDRFSQSCATRVAQIQVAPFPMPMSRPNCPLYTVFANSLSGKFEVAPRRQALIISGMNAYWPDEMAYTHPSFPNQRENPPRWIPDCGHSRPSA